MPNKGLQHYYGRLERHLRGITLRLKLFIALEFLLRLATVFLIFILGSLFLQGVKDGFAYLPFIYYLLALVSLVAVFLLGVWRIASGLSMQRVARSLEEKHPHLRDDVTNSLLLFHQIKQPSGPDPISTELVKAQLRKTSDEILKIQPEKIVNFRKALSHAKLLLPLFFALTATVAFDPAFFNRSLAFILSPFSALPERETFISVEPIPPIILRGTPLMIRAKASGYIPDRLLLRFWPEKGDPIHYDMDSEGDGRFVHRIVSTRRSFRCQFFSGRTRSLVYSVQVVDAPDIEKMKLTLNPPAYTRLAKEVIPEGHIEALKGTIVNLEVQTTKTVQEAKLVLDQKTQLPLHVAGNQLTGNLFVFDPGTYSISVRDELGFENPDPVHYRIQLIPDKYPEAEIISPAEDLEVSANEVLPVIYRARDDFGLTAARLVYQVRSLERSFPLKGLTENRLTATEVFKWDLASLALTPGDRVAYRLEVLDNDTVSGPKTGYSRTLMLRVRDEKDQAARHVAHAQEIADALLELLADQLEDIKTRKELSAEISRIMEKVDGHLQHMGSDTIERFDLESLQRNLATLNRRMDELPRETITREMERLALLAEDLVKKTRMQEVASIAREIRNRQRRLMDALQNRDESLTPQALQDLLKAVDQLKDFISQVMDALSRMATQLPDEFINTPELSGLDFQDMFKDLDEIRQKLVAGDPAAALEAARRLLQNLSEMMAAMARAGAQANTGSLSRLQSEMSRQSNELEKILTEQKEILSDTESVDRELQRSVEAETEKRLERMRSRLQEIIAQLQDLMPSEQRDLISEMNRLLKEGQIEKLRQRLQRLMKQLAELPDIRKRVEELLDQMKSLTPDQSEVMSADSRQKFPDLTSRQQMLKERTQHLGETLETLSQLFPGMDTEIINDIKEGAQSMGKASGSLSQTDASGAIPPEQEAIRKLSRSQQAMQQMAQQMARQMAMRMQANRWAYPWGYDPNPGWYSGPRLPMPTLPQPDVRRPLERGYTGFDREEFDPPSKDAYKAPEILREKVMEALKEDIPSQYRREVESYFKGLTK